MHNASESQPGARKQSSILLCRPLAAPGPDHHVEIGQHDIEGSTALGRHQSFDEKDLARRQQDASAVPQDDQCASIVPIVNHQRQEIRVATCRNFLEEISADTPAAMSHSFRLEQLCRALHHLREIVQDARMLGYALRTDASRRPCPPPTSTSVSMPAKS